MFQLRQKTIAILALLALLLGVIPSLAGALLAMPAPAACCQSNICPMHRVAKSHGRPLCGLHRPYEASLCNMDCCHSQTDHALSGTPFVLTPAGAISAPALFAFAFSPRFDSLLSTAREVTPPPPKSLLT
ncbi:MAG: hypothetical protein WA871_01645 [Candidatus Acidiferrales bacterium]